MNPFFNFSCWVKLAVIVSLHLMTTCWAAEPPQIAAIKISMFLQYSGELSSPLTGKEILWNVISGRGDIPEPTNAALVGVVVKGVKNTYGRNQAVELVVQDERTGKVLERHRGRVGIYGNAGVTHVGFWLPYVGCESLVITASIAGNAKTRTVPFKCGE